MLSDLCCIPSADDNLELSRKKGEEKVAVEEVVQVQKIVVVGGKGVGKASIVHQFLYDDYVCPDYYWEDHLDLHFRKVTLDGKNITVRIRIDGHDHTQYAGIQEARHYFKAGDGRGFMLVFSLTDVGSFTALEELKEKILRLNNPDRAPIILVGNKSDLDAERKVSATEVQEKAKLWNVSYIEISAKIKPEVDAAFFELLREIQRTPK